MESHGSMMFDSESSDRDVDRYRVNFLKMRGLTIETLIKESDGQNLRRIPALLTPLLITYP